MLDGWYCRSLANQGEEVFVKDEQESEEEVTPPATVKGRVPKPHAVGGSGPSSSGLGASVTIDPSSSNGNVVDYKERYKNLKRKLKFLIYENEYFQDLLHTNQRRLLKVSKDRTFLLDRLLLYEKPAKDSSDSDATDSSDCETEQQSVSIAAATTSIGGGAGTSSAQGGATLPTKEAVRRKYKDKESGAATQGSTGGAPRGRKRKIQTENPTQIHPTAKRQLMATVSPSPSAVSVQLQPQPQPQTQQQPPQQVQQQSVAKDVSVVLSTAEITRQLQERRPMMSPECTSATVPATMLSDESPSKCYPHDSFPHLMEDDEVAAEECVPMEYTT